MTQNPSCHAPIWVHVRPLLIHPILSFLLFFSFFGFLSFQCLFIYVCPELEKIWLKLTLLSGPLGPFSVLTTF